MADNYTRIFSPTANATDGYAGGQNTGADRYNYSSHFNTAIAQSWLNRMLIKPLEETLVFMRLGRMENVQNGYLTHAWARPQKIDHMDIHTNGRRTGAGISAAGSKVGQTPDVVPYRISMTTATPEQWVYGIGIADMIQQFNVISYIDTAFDALGKAFARLFDFWIQDRLFAFASGANLTISYHGTQTAPTTLATITNTNKADCLFKLKDLRKMATILSKRSVPKYSVAGAQGGGAGGEYALVVDTNVSHDLLDDNATNALIDIYKHTPETVRRLLNGYIGTYNGVSVIVTEFVTEKKGGAGGATDPTVYPSYMFGQGAFGVLKYRYTGRVISHMMADHEDWGGQRNIASVNAIFQAKVLDPACFLVNLSTSTMTN